MFYSIEKVPLTIFTGKKLCFTQFSARMAVWLLLIFYMFTQSVKCYIFHYYVLRVQGFGECDSSNR